MAENRIGTDPESQKGGIFNLPRPNLALAPVEMPPGREGTPIDATIFNLPRSVGVNLFGRGSP